MKQNIFSKSYRKPSYVYAVAAGLFIAFSGAQASVLPNGGFEQHHNGIPDNWVPETWKSSQTPAHPEMASDAAEGSSCLRLQSVTEGYAGVASSVLTLKENAGIRIHLQLRQASNYSGNKPRVFITWFNDSKYLASKELQLPKFTEPTSWHLFETRISESEIPADCNRLRFNIATSSLKSGTKTTGYLDVDDVKIKIEGQEDEPVTMDIETDHFAQWVVLGDSVEFKLKKGHFPKDTQAVDVEVLDSSSRVIEKTEVKEFEKNGWAWKPKSLGLFQVKFYCLRPNPGGQTLRTPIEATYPQLTAKKNQYLISKDSWLIGVVENRSKPINERNSVFGFSYQYEKEDVLHCADLVGMRFVRIHCVPWGSQFGNTSKAIEPQKGIYHWDEMDEKVKWIKNYGYTIVADVCYTPRWASPHPEQTDINICVPRFASYAPVDVDDFGRFLIKLADRYGNDIKIWELWNEPHLPKGSCFWKDTPERFVAMLKSGYKSLKTVQPDSEVWLGGIGLRYIPFYKQLLKLHGLDYFDVLPMHGAWCDIRPFRELDQKAGVKSKRWVTSEQHSTLYNPVPNGQPGTNSHSTIPSEAGIAKRLVIDSLRQIWLGSERLALFQIKEAWEKEIMPIAAKEGWFIHTSGIFRSHPRLEPRLPAIVWHNVINEVTPNFKIKSQHLLGKIHVVDASNGDKDLLFVWHDETDAQTVPEVFKPILQGAIDWEGRPVGSNNKLDPEVVYMFRAVDSHFSEALPPGQAFPEFDTKKTEKPVPKTSIIRDNLPGVPEWTEIASYSDPSKPIKAKAWFAIAGDREKIELIVKVIDENHHSNNEPGKYWMGDSVQIGFDTQGKGETGDKVQFQIALTESGPVVYKDIAPFIDGALPSEYTPAGRIVEHARADIEKTKNGLLYKISIDTGELYPLELQESDSLRFSILVNDNNGSGREGWVEWGSGIGTNSSPEGFGVLNWK